MKKLVLLAAGALITSTGFSQISIDPEVGVNFSNIRTKLNDEDATTGDAKVGLGGGIGVNFNIAKNVYLRPGIYYQNLGTKTDDNLGNTYSHNFHYLRIPVNIGYNFQISDNAGSVFAEAGPYIGYAIAGQSKAEILGKDVKNDIELGTEAGETNPLDFGVNFGLGYESPWGIYVKGSYGLGLGNMSNVDDFKSTNTHFNVSLGYRIKL